VLIHIKSQTKHNQTDRCRAKAKGIGKGRLNFKDLFNFSINN